jgi:hypothetical protein
MPGNRARPVLRGPGRSNAFRLPDNCVKVQDTGMSIVVADKDGAQVNYDYAEWDSFITGVNEGKFTRTAA